MNKKNIAVLLCAAAALGIAGCASDTGSGEEAVTLVDADESGREAGFSYYEIRNVDEPRGFDVRIFDGLGERLGDVTLSEDDNGTYTRLELAADPRVAEVFQGVGGFSMHVDGTEVLRYEDGAMREGDETAFADAELFVGTLGSLENDDNLMRAIRELRITEQTAICEPAPVDETVDGSGDGGSMSGGDGPGLVFEQADECGYWGCVWKVVKAEAAMAIVAGAVAAAGSACATACAGTFGAACIACAAAFVGGGALALERALATICDACASGCIPGCEGWDCG